jgi:hypothetical protein
MKNRTGWRSSKPGRIRVKGSTIRELEKAVNIKEASGYKLVSKFMKEDVEWVSGSNKKSGRQFKPKYTNYQNYFCIMEYTYDERMTV